MSLGFGFEECRRAAGQSWKCGGQLPVIRQISKQSDTFGVGWSQYSSTCCFICKLGGCEQLDGFIKGTSVKIKNGCRRKGSTLTFDPPKSHTFSTWHFCCEANSNPFPPHLPSLSIDLKINSRSPLAPSVWNSYTEAFWLEVQNSNHSWDRIGTSAKD